jgi:hypothetical protein
VFMWQVTELLRDLCRDLETAETASFNENRSAIARAGGIPQLVRQLKSGTERAQALGVEALSLLALRSGELRVQVTQQLVGLLGAESEEVRQRAGNALREMAAEGGDDSQKASAMAGGVAPLVALLKDGLRDERVEAQEYALSLVVLPSHRASSHLASLTSSRDTWHRYALWSLSLVTDAIARATMVAEGCIGLLVACLAKGLLSAAAQEHAAGVLASISRDTSVHDDIVAAGAVVPLTGLLSGASITGAKKHAANCLSRLALTSDEAQGKIAAAGAIQPLLTWLSEPDVREQGRPSGLPDLAARALDAVASANAHTSGQIVAAGVIAPLVAMLGAGKSSEAQRAAAGLLATLAEVDDTVGTSMYRRCNAPACTVLSHAVSILACFSSLTRPPLARRLRLVPRMALLPPLCQAFAHGLSRPPPCVADRTRRAARARAASLL